MFPSFSLPRVRAQEEEEEDLVDPQEVLRAECASAHCQALKDKLDACTARVNSRKATTENCFEEVVDFMECVDHCVAPKLFKHLK